MSNPVVFSSLHHQIRQVIRHACVGHGHGDHTVVLQEPSEHKEVVALRQFCCQTVVLAQKSSELRRWAIIR